ncbi:TetR/AcrR family transcriptional regulator [Skermania piniformis]|uniref:TetR/AcrR family transcriptional regulator n=1 Tax=Skermania pinensis TaxID=39122 RepID=A0ABX8S7N3_9ACTN|nr:TetR/AcrR family transcriptional regulator [Skermania piniformis]QXQ13281.1 TetR/AcrR family transcriptional regulator [Skermania piniformis]
MPTDDTDYRLNVVDAALQLFAEQGYESTSVDAIAAAAGISRRTLFRQFRSKDDVVFADLEILLGRTRDYLHDDEHADPWLAICAAAMLVYRGYTAEAERARQRYQVVRTVPVLREREIVMVRRYERLFVEYLRSRLPETPGLDRVRFAAAVVTTHNYLLGRMLRGYPSDAEQVWTALVAIRDERTGTHPSDEVVVAVFPRGTRVGELVRTLQNRLGDGL